MNADALTPVGRGVVMLKVTGLETPEVNTAVAISLPVLPAVSVRVDDGFSPRLKLNAACTTTSVKVAVLVAPPPTA